MLARLLLVQRAPNSCVRWKWLCLSCHTACQSHARGAAQCSNWSPGMGCGRAQPPRAPHGSRQNLPARGVRPLHTSLCIAAIKKHRTVSLFCLVLFIGQRYSFKRIVLDPRGLPLQDPALLLHVVKDRLEVFGIHKCGMIGFVLVRIARGEPLDLLMGPQGRSCGVPK